MQSNTHPPFSACKSLDAASLDPLLKGCEQRNNQEPKHRKRPCNQFQAYVTSLSNGVAVVESAVKGDACGCTPHTKGSAMVARSHVPPSQKLQGAAKEYLYVVSKLENPPQNAGFPCGLPNKQYPTKGIPPIIAPLTSWPWSTKSPNLLLTTKRFSKSIQQLGK